MSSVHPTIKGILVAHNVAPPKDDLLDILSEASPLQRRAIVKLLNDGEYLLAAEALAAILKGA